MRVQSALDGSMLSLFGWSVAAFGPGIDTAAVDQRIAVPTRS
jgi:hypothetical protein